MKEVAKGWQMKVAIMKKPAFGFDSDWGGCSLRFNAHLVEGGAATLDLRGQEALDFLKAYQAYNVNALEGKPVWVEVEPITGSPTVRVLGPCLV